MLKLSFQQQQQQAQAQQQLQADAMKEPLKQGVPLPDKTKSVKSIDNPL